MSSRCVALAKSFAIALVHLYNDNVYCSLSTVALELIPVLLSITASGAARTSKRTPKGIPGKGSSMESETPTAYGESATTIFVVSRTTSLVGPIHCAVTSNKSPISAGALTSSRKALARSKRMCPTPPTAVIMSNSPFASSSDLSGVA